MKALIPIAFLAALLFGGAVMLSDFGGGVSHSQAARGYIPSFDLVEEDKGLVSREGCLTWGPQVHSGRCVFGNPSSRKAIVVFGDSHALHWTPALLRIAKWRNWRIIALVRGNCTPALVPINPGCDEWRRNSLERIRKTKPALVILGTNTNRSVVTYKAGIELTRRASDRVLQTGMTRTMRRLLNLGARVTLMRDLFVTPFDTTTCIRQNPATPYRCSFEPYRPLWLSFDYMAARRMKRVQIIDPLPKVCGGGRCRSASGRILKFRDRGHLSASYVSTLGAWLGRRLQKP